MKKWFLGLVATMLLTSCQSVGKTILEGGLQGATNSEIHQGAICNNVKLNCPEHRYREWETPDGKLGCSCAHVQ